MIGVDMELGRVMSKARVTGRAGFKAWATSRAGSRPG